MRLLRLDHRNATRIIAWTMVVVAVVGAGLGLWMRLTIGSGDAAASAIAHADAYNRALSLHGALLAFGLLWPGLAGLVGNRWLADRAPQGGRGGAIACAGAVVWQLGLVSLAVAALSASPDADPLALDSTPYKIRLSLLLLGDSMVMLGILVGLREAGAGGKPPREAEVLQHALAWAAVTSVLVDALCLVTTWDPARIPSYRSEVVGEGVLVGLVLLALGGPRGSVGRGLAIAAIVLTNLGVVLTEAGRAAWLGADDLSSVGTSVSVLGRALVVVALAALWRLRTMTPTVARGYVAVARWAFWLWWPAGALLATISADVHLHDTYFVVGSFHLQQLTVVGVGSMIALRHFWRAGYERLGPWVRAVPVVLVGVGLVWMCMAMLAIGQDGMPRRYVTYIPQFEGLHRQITIAAFVMVAGFALEAVAWIRARRA